MNLARLLRSISSSALVALVLSPLEAAQVSAGIQTGPVMPTGEPGVLSFGTATTIDFDDVVAPCVFQSTLPLSAEYAGQGVLFAGPAAQDGGGRLNACGGFSVTGFSPPNFLAFNVTASYVGGGVPRGPETIFFDVPVDEVQLRAGSPNPGEVRLDGYDAGGNLLASDTAMVVSALQPLSVTADGIRYCVISFTSLWLVVDDLAWVPSPCVTLDFGSEDDLVTPLVNGQHLNDEFGLLATLASAGANAGLAVFDSTPGGPNDPSQDRDLLVGTGNLLVLQTENFPPDANDIFPRPNDDDDGGTMTFAFTREVELRSLRLVDIDAGDAASSIVQTDAVGRTRTHLVPGNWTGDLLLGQPGHGVLDLAALAAQPGFGSVATAQEVVGFDPARVVRLDVHLGGSGGIDDLVVCGGELAAASALPRNGMGLNPRVMSALSRPVLGQTWSVALDCGRAGLGAPSGVAVLELRTLPATGTITPFGEILASGTLLLRASRTVSVGPSTFQVAIPPSLALLGARLYAQGSCHGSTASGPKVRQARQVLTNALDLVVGF